MRYPNVSSCSADRPTVARGDDCAACEPRSVLSAFLYPSWLYSMLVHVMSKADVFDVVVLSGRVIALSSLRGSDADGDDI